METILARGVSAVMAAAALPEPGDLTEELGCVEAASGRGYFLPDEEELIRLRYSQYLSLRAALIETLGGLGAMAGRGAVEWRDRLPVFATAFAAACVLMRADRFLIDRAAEAGRAETGGVVSVVFVSAEEPFGVEEGDVRVFRGIRPGGGGTAAAGDQAVRCAETDHQRGCGRIFC